MFQIPMDNKVILEATNKFLDDQQKERERVSEMIQKYGWEHSALGTCKWKWVCHHNGDCPVVCGVTTDVTPRWMVEFYGG